MTQRILASLIGVILVGVVFAALLGLGVAALAQGGTGSGCEGCELAASGACSENAAVVAVTGTVAETLLDQEAAALILNVTDRAPVRVELGPPSYLDGLGFTAQTGDRLAVTGHYSVDETVLMAHTIVSERTGQTFVFYDGSGHPLWIDEGCDH